MNRALLSRPTGALAVLGLLALAAPASAKVLLDGLITWGNGLGDLLYQCPGVPNPGVMNGPHNDLSVAPLPGFNGVFPNTDFKPAQTSIANGDVDDVATLAYQDADPCNLCGAQRRFTNVCYRGAVDPHDAAPDWTHEPWITYGNFPEVRPAGWETRAIKFYSGLQPSSHWTADTVRVCQGRVGFPAGTTLVVDPGTLIVGEGATGPSFVAIERGAKVIMNGTPTNPITGTCDADPPIIGGWGGLVMHGRAVANCADCLGGASCASEGDVGALFCGTDDCDSSGSVTYTRICYSGIEISPNNELNTFTQNALGSRTVISHCESIQGSDDDFEWFGGLVSDDHLIGIGGGDDGLDWQMGWRGACQFAVIQKYANQGDKGIEADNNEFNFEAPCRSNPIFANITLVGIQDTGSTDTWGIHLRRGTDGQIFNSIITNFPRQAVNVEHNETMERGLNPYTASYACGTRVDAPVVAASTFGMDVRAFPNPVSRGTSFQFSLPSSGPARLDVYDVTGRRVASLMDETNLSAGAHSVEWTPETSLPAGAYFYRLETASHPSQGRLVLVR